MNKSAIYLLLVLMMGGSISAQIKQAQKSRDRLNASEQASADAKAGKVAGPGYRAKINVDVQMVLARQDVKTFAEAKPLAVNKIADGEPAWLYIKIANGNLGKWVYRTKGEESEDRYLLALQVGAPGNMMAKSSYLLSFTEPELELTELKIALTNGIPGRNRSLPFLLKTAIAPIAKPGIVASEVRLLDQFAFPRGDSEYLAKFPLAIDLTKGAVKYQPMLDSYASGVLRGTDDRSKLPVEGKYDDAGIRARLMNELNESGVDPDKVWFAADDWVEYSDLPMAVMQIRTMPAAFTYKRDGSCFYGVVEITQPFDGMTSRYGASVFKIDRDIPMPCSK